MKLLSIFLISLAPAAYALDTCDELWLARNAIFDAHGQCFSSPLAKSVFTNEGCPKPLAAFSEETIQRLARVRNKEKMLGCKVDNTRTKLNVEAPKMRLLVTQPVAEETESACIGYSGNNPIYLYTKPNETGVQLASIQKGDTVLWGYETEGDWDFLIVTNTAGDKTVGWTNDPIKPCSSYAG